MTNRKNVTIVLFVSAVLLVLTTISLISTLSINSIDTVSAQNIAQAASTCSGSGGTFSCQENVCEWSRFEAGYFCKRVTKSENFSCVVGALGDCQQPTTLNEYNKTQGGNCIISSNECTDGSKCGRVQFSYAGSPGAPVCSSYTPGSYKPLPDEDIPPVEPCDLILTATPTVSPPGGYAPLSTTLSISAKVENRAGPISRTCGWILGYEFHNGEDWQTAQYLPEADGNFTPSTVNKQTHTYNKAGTYTAKGRFVVSTPNGVNQWSALRSTTVKVTEEPDDPVCTPTATVEFKNIACGGGTCAGDKMQQTKTVGDTCSTSTTKTTSCVSSPLCVLPPPTVDIKANGSDSPIFINSGTSATISWTSTNATRCLVVDANGERSRLLSEKSMSTGNLTSLMTYKATCWNSVDVPASDFVTVKINPPTVNIKGDGKDGPLTINEGESVDISWTSTGASSCSINNGFGSVGTSGSRSTGSLTNSRTYTATCGSASDSVVIKVIGKIDPPGADIRANGSNGPIEIDSGTSVTIKWDSEFVDSCIVTPGGWTGLSGSKPTGSLTSSETYKISCDNSSTGANVVDTVLVTVISAPTTQCSDGVDNDGDGKTDFPADPGCSGSNDNNERDTTQCSDGVDNDGDGLIDGADPGCSGGGDNNEYNAPPPTISATPGTIIRGETSSLLEWSYSGASQCSINGSNVDPIDDDIVSPLTTTTYKITCGSDSDSATVSVSVPDPVVTLKAIPSVVFKGGVTTLTWSATNLIGGEGCVASGDWSGNKGKSGEEELEPDGNSTYTLTCTNNLGGSGSKTITVTIPFLDEVIPQ